MATTNDGRDASGKFTPGCNAGPGRPRKIVELSYLKAFRGALSPEDFGRVVSKALEQALAGDSAARHWLSRFALGEAPPTLRQLASVEHAASSLDAAIHQAIEGDAQFEQMRLSAGVM